MAEKTVTIQAEIPESLFKTLESLANKRGVDANTVLQQAIVNEEFFHDTVSKGGNVLIGDKNNTLRKVNLR